MVSTAVSAGLSQPFTVWVTKKSCTPAVVIPVAKGEPVPVTGLNVESSYQLMLLPTAVKSGTESPKQMAVSLVTGAAVSRELC